MSSPWEVPPSKRWAQRTDIRDRRPLSNACLDALSAAAQKKGRPLTDAERAEILKRFAEK
jgi:acyl-CoA reductase-like NAD-dependent aldehyde dehydrogenase